MRAVAYSIRSFEKEHLARANKKKHDITLISNPLGLETASFAQGKEAVIISNHDQLSELVINRLADLGVKYITVRSSDLKNIDQEAADRRNIKIANVPVRSDFSEPEQFRITLQEIASCTIFNLDHWQDNSCSGENGDCHHASAAEKINTQKSA